jgi:hypothetical protein
MLEQQFDSLDEAIFDAVDRFVHAVEQHFPHQAPGLAAAYAALMDCWIAAENVLSMVSFYAWCLAHPRHAWFITAAAAAVVRSWLLSRYFMLRLYCYYNGPALWPVAVAAVAWPFVMYICWHLATLR